MFTRIDFVFCNGLVTAPFAGFIWGLSGATSTIPAKASLFSSMLLASLFSIPSSFALLICFLSKPLAACNAAIVASNACCGGVSVSSFSVFCFAKTPEMAAGSTLSSSADISLVAPPKSAANKRSSPLASVFTAFEGAAPAPDM